MRETVTLFVPEGYASADEFLKDCQFERAKREPPAPPSPGSRLQAAISLWHRFADSNVEEWEDETHQAEYLDAIDGLATGWLFNIMLSRINFDGMDPRTFSLAELQKAIVGAEWPK
jgi:hypothetical protein